jgi:hypothetical protein
MFAVKLLVLASAPVCASVSLRQDYSEAQTAAAAEQFKAMGDVRESLFFLLISTLFSSQELPSIAKLRRDPHAFLLFFDFLSARLLRL